MTGDDCIVEDGELDSCAKSSSEGIGDRLLDFASGDGFRNGRFCWNNWKLGEREFESRY